MFLISKDRAGTKKKNNNSKKKGKKRSQRQEEPCGCFKSESATEGKGKENFWVPKTEEDEER